jgi:hypothetical protein
LADGYVRLVTNNSQLTLVRDALFYAVIAGVLMRSVARRQRLVLPRWTGFVVAFVAIALAELLNPYNQSYWIAFQGLRPHLEWVPLFFFGFVLLREPKHLRIFLVLLLVVAAANGIVSYIQAHLTPEQLASWGPGYADRVLGKGRFYSAGRVYYDSTGGHTRPLALGSDTGFGGLVGVLALPGALALIATGRRRIYQLLGVALAVGAAIGVVTSQQRTSVIAAIAAVVAFAALASVSGRALRSIAGLAVMAVIFYGVIHQVQANSSYNPFERYSTIAPTQLLGSTKSNRGVSLAEIPRYFTNAPLGVGLGRAGPAAGLSDNTGIGLITGAGPNSETEANYLLSELGVPGLLIVLLLHISVILVAFKTVRCVRDPETRLLLAGVTAPMVAMLLMWVTTTTTANAPLSPYFWFVTGGMAYWSSIAIRHRARSV